MQLTAHRQKFGGIWRHWLPSPLLGSVWAAFCLTLILCIPAPEFFLNNTDHGYQLALAATLLEGGLPGFSVQTQYGPMVPVLSALASLALPGVAGEALLCAAGFAWTIALCFGMVRRHAGSIMAGLVALALLMLLARFYKWYYWLFPLLGLRLAEAVRPRLLADRPLGALLLLWGGVAGVGGLLRFDLGLESVVFGSMVIMLFGVERHGRLAWIRPTLPLLTRFLFASMVLPALFLLAIWLTSGGDGLYEYWRSVVDGTRNTVVAYGISPFAFDLRNLLSQGNALALLHFLIPLVYACGLGLALAELLHAPRMSERSAMLFGASLTGIGILPQALHRADAQHLLQVLPPLLIVLPLLLGRLPMLRTGPWRAALIVALVLTTGGLAGLLPQGGIDLDRPWRNPFRTWGRLAHLPASAPEHPLADMALAIRRLVSPHQPVLILAANTPSPMLYFARRRQAGVFPIYEPGMYAGDYWRGRNVAALRRSPPAAIVVPRGPVAFPTPLPTELGNAYLATYNILLYENATYRLLRAERPCFPALASVCEN